MLKKVFPFFLLAALAVGLVGCGTANSAQAAAPTTDAFYGGRGYGRGGPQGGGAGASQQNFGSSALSLPASDLSDEEAQGLLYMREEEKLAHDVYITLYNQWHSQVFSNISRSEQMHMDMVLGLIDKYGLDDPAAGKGLGEFTNPELQALYDKLVAQGSQSLADALKVGAAIEEIDILDLQARLAQTDNADIQQVYQNLMAGSENHLRAFTRTLEAQTGETYQPQYLSQDVYDAIISSAPSFGGGYGGGRGRGGYGH